MKRTAIQLLEELHTVQRTLTDKHRELLEAIIHGNPRREKELQAEVDQLSARVMDLIGRVQKKLTGTDGVSGS